MIIKTFSLLILLSFSMSSLAAELVQVRMQTNKGSIEIELDKKSAPATVDNFLRYVKDGFYEGTVFHRVIKGFMIQGGGFSADLTRKETHPPIENEADNGLQNKRGTIAMARTNMPHSASSQFFINTVNNDFLNFRNKTMRGWGYTVFGKVTKGMDVVDSIENTPTGARGIFPQDVPTQDIVIQKIEIIE